MIVNESKFKAKLKKTQTEDEIIIEQYINGEKITQRSIISDHKNYDHNRENLADVIYLLNELMRQTQTYQNCIIFLQSVIDEKIKHSKAEICKKTLKEIKSDYNDFLLGHNRED